MGRMKEGMVCFEFPYRDPGFGISWDIFPIPREQAEELLREMAAELGYNLIKCVED